MLPRVEALACCNLSQEISSRQNINLSSQCLTPIPGIVRCQPTDTFTLHSFPRAQYFITFNPTYIMANYWASLPPAIVGIILSHVAREAASDHTLAGYAAVNKDWQYSFEQFTFRKLSLRPDDLFDFEMTVSTHPERSKWLRAVSFHDHADGGRSERPILEHDPSQTVFSLLHLLEKWDHDANLLLALYLSAHTTNSLAPRMAASFHASDNASFVHSTTQPRELEKDLPGHIFRGIPAVRSFSIQYQGKEVTSTQTVIRLCSEFRGLEELCLQDLDHHNEHTKQISIAQLTPGLPTTLNRLHVIGQGSKAGQSGSASRFLVQRLVWFGMAAQLKELSITTSGNAAEEFFENFRYLTSNSAPTCGNLHWPALESLTLNCSLLRPRISRAIVNRFLHQAGIAALGLPRLRELRLLSYSVRRPEEVNGLFRYVVGSQGEAAASCSGEWAKVTLECSRKACLMSLTGITVSKHIRMARLVMETWRGVAWKSHRAVLRFSSDVCHQSPLVTVERLVGEHGRSEFQDIKYPRPYWTANQGVHDLLGAVILFAALVSFLSFLVRHISLKEQVVG